MRLSFSQFRLTVKSLGSVRYGLYVMTPVVNEKHTLGRNAPVGHVQNAEHNVARIKGKGIGLFLGK